MTSSAPRHRDAFALGGWLFADLLLAVTVLFLAASPAGTAPAPTPSPTPTLAPSQTPGASMSAAPSPSPTPEPTACAATVVLSKNTLVVAATRPGVQATDAALIRAFGKFKGRRVGLLLTFVHGSTDGAGVAAAAKVNALLRKTYPSEVYKLTITEDYYNNKDSVGTVTFIAYLLAQDCIQ